MRLIKVNKSSRTASEADLDDGLSIEVGELTAHGKQQFRQGKGKRHKWRNDDSNGLQDSLLSPKLGETRDLFAESEDRPGSRRSSKKKRSSSKDKASADDVYNRGIYLLSMREHSVKELSNKLVQKFPTSNDVEQAVERLIANKYVSDERFTEAYIRQRANKGLGPIKIRAELFNKGIKNSLVEQYLDVESSSWIESAQVQYQKKFGDSKVVDYKDWARRARFLQGRGYSSKHIECSVPEFDS